MDAPSTHVGTPPAMANRAAQNSATANHDEARLVFFLVGERSTLVIFPLKTAPAFFPNASDVTILGAQKDGFLQPNKIAITKDGQSKEIP